MSLFMTSTERENFLYNKENNPELKRLWDNLKNRTLLNMEKQGIVQDGDVTDWWYLCLERLSDAAFVYNITKNEKVRIWLHDTVIDICGKSIEDWTGPWIRKVLADLKVGSLETAHVGIGVAAVYEMCNDIFSTEEKEIITNTLRQKCQLLCKAFVDRIIHENLSRTNWYIVLLAGYAVTSAVLDDYDAVLSCLDYAKIAVDLYNKDSYGESLQYSNYASLFLSQMWEVIHNYKEELINNSDLHVYSGLMRWYAASYMYKKPLNGWGDEQLPRCVNFGDSAAIFRPSGDLLLHISARFKNTEPDNAALASWLFFENYRDFTGVQKESSSFGFINDYGYKSLLLFGDIAKPRSPKSIGMDTLNSFDVGNVIIRDSWDNTKTVLAIMAAQKTPNAAVHRHADQNSFILSFNNERFLADGGHCCYRLKTQKFSASALNHSVWYFTDSNDNIYHQELIKIGGKDLEPSTVYRNDNFYVISSDIAKLYGDNFLTAQRNWVVLMPNIILIADVIKTKKPVRCVTGFLANNRDNGTNEHCFKDGRVVLRRGKSAMKLLPMYHNGNNTDFSYDFGYIHDCYHYRPHQRGQGSEGSGLIYKYTTDFKTNHLNMYAIIVSYESEIPYWHSKPVTDNTWKIDSPDHNVGLVAEKLNDCLKITNIQTDEIYNIKL